MGTFKKNPSCTSQYALPMFPPFFEPNFIVSILDSTFCIVGVEFKISIRILYIRISPPRALLNSITKKINQSINKDSIDRKKKKKSQLTCIVESRKYWTGVMCQFGFGEFYVSAWL